MTAAVAAGVAALAMAGVLLLARGLVGPPGSLDAAMAELHRPRAAVATADRGSVVAWLSGTPSDRVRSDLAVLERDVGRYVQDRLKWATLVAVLVGVGAVVVPLGAGAAVQPPVPLVGALLGATGGWFYAAVDLHADAEKARREVRHAVASYLELVTILMAGGAGPESALYVGAEVGRGPAFRHLRAALAAAQVRQEPPWAMFGVLGRRLAVDELIELGASMTLAGGGAQVKDSLAVKASSIRVSDLARIEAEAQARSETMALPVVMMFTGFLLLLGYPAMAGLAGP